MTDNDGNWERNLIEKLAMSALREQRRARMWGIFFKLLAFSFVAMIIVLAIDWRGVGVEAKGVPHTALIDVDWLIAPGTDASADKVIHALQAAYKDPNTRGVILRCDSPGGTPVQARLIYEEMRRLRKKYPAIPLYTVVEDLCASGGYYVAVGADKIFVNRSSIIGSIGVRLDSFGFTGLMEKLGVERRLLTAGTNKAMLDPFEPVDPAQKQYMQSMLEEVHQQFIDVVREGRGKRLKETPDMFSGLIWTGEKGVKLGLADGFGDVGYVARDVIKAPKIIDFTQTESFAEKIARRIGMGAATALGDLLLRSEATQPR